MELKMDMKNSEGYGIAQGLEPVVELADLELSMVGGGCGDITLGKPIR
jgi:hypothetical protein